jgi:hypothetical protein
MIDPFEMYHIINFLKEYGPMSEFFLVPLLMNGSKGTDFHNQLKLLREWNLIVVSYSPHDFSIRYGIHKDVSNL